MFLATIKTCTDEQTIIQRLFNSYNAACSWLDNEIKEWEDCHKSGYINNTDWKPASSFWRLTHWKDAQSNDEVFYFIHEIKPDDPKSEIEWA